MSDWHDLDGADPGDPWVIEPARTARRRRRAAGAGTAVALTALGGAGAAQAAIPPPSPDGLRNEAPSSAAPTTAPAAPKPATPRKVTAPASKATPSTPPPSGLLPPVGPVKVVPAKPKPAAAKPKSKPASSAPPPPGLLPPVGPVKTVPAKPKTAKPKPAASKPKPVAAKPAPAHPKLPPNVDKLPVNVRIVIGADGSTGAPPPKRSPQATPVLLPPVGDAVVIDSGGHKTTVHPDDPRYPYSGTKPTVPNTGTTTAPRHQSKPNGPQPTASPTPSPSPQAPPPAPQPAQPADPLPPLPSLPGDAAAGHGKPKAAKPATPNPPATPKPTGPPPVLLPPVGDAVVIDRHGHKTVAKPGSRNYPKSATPPGVPIGAHTHPTQHDRDVVAALPNLEAMGINSPAKAEAARRRLARPIGELQGRIEELNETITDLEGRNAPGAVRVAKKELADRQLQLLLYTNQACDYECDLDAPYQHTGNDNLNAAAKGLGGDPSVRTVVAYAIRMEAIRQQVESIKDSGPSLHDVLNVAGYIPVVGAVFDGANAAYYYAEGNVEEGTWAAAGAVPFAGDAAKGARTARKVYKGLEDAKDAKTAAKVIEAAGEAGRGEARFAQNMERKITDDESRKALDQIFKATASGTRANAKYLDKFLPSRTRGYAAELGALDRLGKDATISRIRLIPARRGRRSPDFVVTRNGKDVRVEVTAYMGGIRGYAKRGLGRAKPPTERQISNLIWRKVGGKRTQFNSDLPGVSKMNGELDARLHGGANSVADVDRAVERTTSGLLRQQLSEVRFTIAPGQVLRYVRDGTRYVRKP